MTNHTSEGRDLGAAATCGRGPPNGAVAPDLIQTCSGQTCSASAWGVPERAAHRSVAENMNGPWHALGEGDTMNGPHEPPGNIMLCSSYLESFFFGAGISLVFRALQCCKAVFVFIVMQYHTLGRTE